MTALLQSPVPQQWDGQTQRTVVLVDAQDVIVTLAAATFIEGFIVSRARRGHVTCWYVPTYEVSVTRRAAVLMELGV